MGKIFLWKNRLDKICKSDDKTITMNIPPIIANAKIFPVKRPTTANVAPKPKAPPSPKNILAGQILKYKKAKSAPIQIPMKDAKGKLRIDEATAKKAKRQISKSPADKPSNPSEIL